MKKITDAKAYKELLENIAARFRADNPDAFKKGQVGLVGIHTRGVHLARRIAGIFKVKYRQEVSVGSLDITLYRDDVAEIGSQPLVKETDIPFSVEGKTILLVDDVLYTGRTIRAALDALLELGRPKVIRLAVVASRQGRELPVQADYVGAHVAAGPAEVVRIKIKELDKEDGVFVLKRSELSRG